MSKIKVLIIDDSVLTRTVLKNIILSDPDFIVIGEASNPYEARKYVKEGKPDVITLDVEMPKMDGITFLEKLMDKYPTPVIMVSSLTDKHSKITMKALELGAIDFIKKPSAPIELHSLKNEIIEKLKMAVKAKILPQKTLDSKFKTGLKEKIDVDEYIKDYKTKIIKTDPVIVIGASTGGTVAIETIFKRLKTGVKPIVVTQHMPVGFTKAFAERLNSTCPIRVKEAENGDKLEQGLALIAPGGKHMLLQRSGTTYYVEVKDGPPINRHKPSVDVLFKSAANSAGSNAIAVILTGMGDDGAKGMLALKEKGAFTIAQDEESCVVFGMPKEAIKLNAVKKIVPLLKIPFILNEI